MSKIPQEAIEAFDSLSPNESIGAFGGSGQWIELCTVEELRAFEITADAARAQAQGVEWLPFSSAPKNGVSFEVFTDNGDVIPNVWFDGQDFVVSPSYAPTGKFVSWRLSNA